MTVPSRFRNMPILAKVIHAINWFIDLVYVENGTLFSRTTTFIMMVIGIAIIIILLIRIGYYFYYSLF